MPVSYPFSVDSLTQFLARYATRFSVVLLALAVFGGYIKHAVLYGLVCLSLESYVLYNYKSKLPQSEYPHLGKNDVALVTGGSNGLGLAIVKLLVENYGLQRVFVLDVVTPKQDLGEAVKCIQCDLSSAEDVELALKTVFKECEKSGQNLSVLVNNAGIRLDGSFLSLTRESIQKVVDINTIAPVLISKSVVGRHIEQNPSKKFSVVTVSSVLGAFGACNVSAYSASKAAATQFHEVFTQELKGFDSIRMLLVTPGQLTTDMFRDVAQTRPFFVPLVDHNDLARLILEKVDMGEAGILCEPFYANFGYLLKALPWSLQLQIRRLSKMDETIPS